MIGSDLKSPRGPSEAISRWKELRLSEFRSPFEDPVPVPLIPLHDSPMFRRLSAKEQQALGREFIKMTAETLITLEQAFLAARLYLPETARSAATHEGYRQLAREELYHSLAFREFLRGEPSFGWPKANLLLFQDRWARNALFFVARRSPVALCLPAAKLEAYAVSYANQVRLAYGGWETNRWTKLQHLHLLDEARHVPFQISAHASWFPRSAAKRIHVAICLLSFVIALQAIQLGGTWRMVRQALAGRSRIHRIGWTLRISHWIIRRSQPYLDARSHMKRLLSAPGLPWARLFSFLAW